MRGGEIIAAAQEERFTRVKHDRAFPINAVRYCLGQAGLTARELDAVIYYDKPLLTFDRLLETYLAFAPRGFKSFAQAMPVWLHEKLHLPREIDDALEGQYPGTILFCLHHLSHAASAFYPSPFESAAILTVDGVGEWSTATLGVGQGSSVKLLKEIRFPHSLGLLYSAFTYYAGFKVNSGEYKLMGLAPYGRPVYADMIRRHLIDLKEDGSFRLDMRYFNYAAGLTMTSEAFHALFGGPPRGAEGEMTQRHLDAAASIQEVTNEAMLKLARHARTETGERRLCLAGGVALNCVANGLILREKVFDEIFVQPAAGDAGGALGSALFAAHAIRGQPRAPRRPDAMKGSLLGPDYPPEEIRAALETERIPYRELGDEALVAELAAILAAGGVVGLFRGRMEYGPRALGARSIIADPRDPGMQQRLNLKIKFREGFRPFAPSVREEDAAEYFELDAASPYMLMVAPVREAQRKPLAAVGESLSGLKLLQLDRSTIPAVTHVDYSARIQTVSREVSPFYHRVLTAFKELQGCPVLVNTSFNVRGEPIVCSPTDAVRCFLNTGIDALAMDGFLALKADAPNKSDRADYLKEFAPD